MTHHVPNGFHTVTPFILVKHADRVIGFRSARSVRAKAS